MCCAVLCCTVLWYAADNVPTVNQYSVCGLIHGYLSNFTAYLIALHIAIICVPKSVNILRSSHPAIILVLYTHSEWYRQKSLFKVRISANFRLWEKYFRKNLKKRKAKRSALLLWTQSALCSRFEITCINAFQRRSINSWNSGLWYKRVSRSFRFVNKLFPRNGYHWCAPNYWTHS